MREERIERRSTDEYVSSQENRRGCQAALLSTVGIVCNQPRIFQRKMHNPHAQRPWPKPSSEQ
eukprot:scaffold7491_cov142-Skeletonema_menzelii.AAC.10